MNIWYLNHYAGGPGIGRYSRAFYLARAWKALGHDTTVFVARFHHLMDETSPLPAEMTVGSVRYVSLPARVYAGNGRGRFLNIADYCRAVLRLPSRVAHDLQPPDAIIVTSPHPFAIYPARRLARRYGAALVFEARDLWSLSMVEANGAANLHPFVVLSRNAERFAYRHSDLVASLLANAEGHMREQGLAPGKFIHVPNGLDLDNPVLPSVPTSEAGRSAARQLAAWKEEGRVVVIHPGTHGAANGLDRLLDALHILKKEGLEQRFGVLMPGHGEMTGDLKAQAHRLELANVAFGGQVVKAEALWLTAHSDIGYAGGRDIPNLYRYGISFNKITDFMEAGLPVVLPLAAGGDPVSASGCGIVTGCGRPPEIARAIADLVNSDPETRRVIGAKGKAYAARHLDYRRIAADFADAMSKARPR